ncbi:MAG: hypothetical protein HC927_11275 [Deltaproteobacteria bacterium]|nr:hypothetical protein [Deltaproteobacteria bacterium]
MRSRIKAVGGETRFTPARDGESLGRIQQRGDGETVPIGKHLVVPARRDALCSQFEQLRQSLVDGGVWRELR